MISAADLPGAAERELPDLDTTDPDDAVRTAAGTARPTGVRVAPAG
ncbi:MAG: hypothetical protein AVDCRST_MAG66-2130 [uncultured Pseudonocardia sp.]|uniref:Uncharacterized protein n=1 Tax=uncultured Pseudonocardia sp. TaxID=211455 RepID=A0A6J4PD41_9PSEU|nr:MAG: hypothetical protein AVDCRST_MAG66-2130 [uncultured Pseudonocardia sp.]